MKFELKNVKYASFASEETSCYSASLYVDGKRIGEVGNDGHGGCDRFIGSDDAFVAANDWCKANLPQWEMNGKKFPTDLEMHCADLLERHLATKDFRRMIKSKVALYKDGSVYTVNAKPSPSTILSAEKRWPDHTVLNAIPEIEALKLYAPQHFGSEAATA